MIEEILRDLNDEQKEAVKHVDGPCYVIAGPGSGKTRVITARTQYLIANGIKPENIVLFTFTNKAANEIKERVKKAVGPSAESITVGTYHSICSRLLRKYAVYIDYAKSFTILNQDESDKILKEVCKSYNVPHEVAKSYISRCKSECITYKDASKNARESNDVTNAKIYTDYEKELEVRMSMDFDDLLLNTIRILESFPEIKKEVNNRFKYVMADEAHDSSRTDLRLIKLLSSYNNNLCMIFDDYQSIYGFRGSDVNAVINFKNQFDNIKLYNLSQNYRSTKHIVEAAKGIISNNKNQIKKDIVSARGIDGEKVVVINSNTQNLEYYSILGLIKMMRKKGNDYKDIAILYRTGSQSRGVEQVLMNEQIPYKIYGGTPFFTRMEIQDVLSYIRLIVNDRDFTALERSINTPKRGIGDKSLEAFEEFARTNLLDYDKSLLDSIEEYDGFKGKAKKGFEKYKSLIKDFKLKKLELSPSDFITYVVKNIEYLDYLYGLEDDPTVRIENLTELVNAAYQHNDIEELLEQASLYIEEDEEEKDMVQLMTMHASKGLEFKTVIIMDAVEDISPHFRSKGSFAEIAEERRLMYVAATRAKDNLFIMVPKCILAGKRPMYKKESRFVEEIPDEHKVYM